MNSGKAAFISYASQDAAVARRICEAVRAAGVEVWFDQSELRGGDAWDQKIRKQIKECVLFLPIISASTQARTEGYFRLEWRLADQRTHLMAKGRPFLLPIVIDDTVDSEAQVPESFLEVQWTRLPGGEAPAEFGQRVRALLDGKSASFAPGVRPPAAAPGATKRRVMAPAIAAIVAALGLVAVWVRAPWLKDLLNSGQRTEFSATSEPRRLASRARQLFENPAYTGDDLALAEDFCREAIRRAPNDAEVWAVYSELSSEFIGGRTDWSAERFEMARMQAERALKLAPTSTEARFAKACYLRRVGGASRSEAEQLLRELVRETPTDSRVLIGLGKVIWGNFGMAAGRNLERADEAMAFFNQAAAFPAARAEALGEIAWLHFNLGRFEECEANVTESLRLRMSKSAVQTKVRVSLARADLQAARAALGMMPTDLARSDAGIALGAAVWLCSRDWQKCLEVLSLVPREYISSDNYRGPVDLLRGYAYQMGGKPQAALNAWRSALQIVDKRLGERPRDDDSLFNRAWLLALLGDHDSAVSALRLYEEINAGARPIADLAGVHVLLDSPDQAIDYIARARQGRPLDALRVDFRFESLRAHPRFQELFPPNPVSTRTATAGVKSVAVLAFENLSEDKSNEYFSDGISDELINVLGRVPGLQVKGRTSAFYFKGKTVPAAEIAQQLGVSYLVRGSVRKEGDTVRITAQLSRAQSDDLLWSSEPIERKVKDVFSLQEEIARTIAQNLSLKLGASRRQPEGDAEANRLVLEGRYYWRSRSVEGFARAEELFGQALKKDPTFAAAHASQAMLCVSRALFRFVEGYDDFQSDIDRARSAAASAVAFDASLVEAHAVLAYASLLNGELGRSEQQFQRALSLNPHAPATLQWQSLLFVQQGRLDLALAASKAAIAVDPLSPQALYDHALQLYYAREYSAGLEIIDRSLRLRPEFLPAHSLRAICLAHLGRTDEAVTVARKIRADPTPQRWLADLFALRVLRSANLREEAEPYAAELLRTTPEGNFKRSLLMAILGRYDEALASARKIPRRPLSAFYFFWSGDWDPVRDDPRFEQILRTQGCVEEYRVARRTLAQMPTPIPAR